MAQRSFSSPLFLSVFLFASLAGHGQSTSLVDTLDTQVATCGKPNGTLTVITHGGTPPYTYSITGGTPVVTINNGSNNVFNNITGGAYSVTIKDNGGHDTTLFTQIGDILGPTLVSMVPTQAATCANDDGVVQVNLLNGTPPFTFYVNGDSVGSTDSESGYARKMASGVQSITVKDDNGCQLIDVATVPLNNNLTLTMNGGATLCEGASDTLRATTNATGFSWSPATGLNDPNIPTPVASPSTTTTYTLTATLGVCSATGSAVLTVLPAPVANAGAAVSTCYGKSVQLQGSGGVSYIWAPAAGLSDPAIADPVVENPTSSIDYSLMVKDANGCTSLNASTVAVTVRPPYRVSAGNDTSVVAGQTVQFQAVDVDNVGFTSYTWSPEDGLSNPTIADPVGTYPTPGVYTYVLTAVAPDGCEGADSITVKVFTLADIIVPSAFTPNNDGHNDYLRAIAVGIREFRGFSVFDRWGNRVFETTNAAIGWDGTLNGRQLPMGTYVWMAAGVDYTGRLVEKRGTVILIR